MCNESNPAGSRPELPLKPDSMPPHTVGRRHGPHWHWVKRMLACNPFYLVSAALLLFGIYRVSVDPNFLRTETAQLIFNFTSLQFYELLLVFTAIVLARRCIWYDATLLVFLENLLVLVPFILVSQAALIERETVWKLCAAAALIALGRCAAARRPIYVRAFSPGFLAGGLAILAVNVALPILYRTFHETKFGTKPDSGTAYAMNELSWLWVLPALCALVNLLPRLRENGELLVQRRWFPVSLLLLWIAGTGVHLYSLGYVYDFDLRRELLAPALCVLAWTLYRRLIDFIAVPARSALAAMLVLPMLASLFAAGVEESRVFFALSVLNAMGFSVVVFLDRSNRVAFHLLLISAAAIVASLPQEWTQPAAIDFSREKFVAVVVLAYLLLSTALSRNPKAGLLGAFAAVTAGWWLSGRQTDALHWAAQAGLVFFVLHSLRWRDYEHQGAAGVRVFISLLWVAHSFAWVWDDARFWHPIAMAGVVLIAWWFRGFVFRVWPPFVVPVASALVALCSPINFACAKLQTTPLGVIAIVGSFLLFAAGTATAFTKHRWHSNGQS